MRVLGLDYGEKRIGMAVADTSVPVAVPRGEARNEGERTIAALAAFCKRESVGFIVLGLPVTMAGEEGGMAKAVREFGDKLQERGGVGVEFVDERLSTKAALGKGVVSVDAAAAAKILQTWLDRRSKKNEVE